MRVPIRYEDLTVEQFQQLEALKKEEGLELIDRAVKRLSILSGKSIDEIEELSPTRVHQSIVKAVFLTNPIHLIEVKKEPIKLGNKQFKAITDLHGFNVSQRKDYIEFLKANNNDYTKCLVELVCLCHAELKDGEFKYIEKNHFENKELFKQARLSEVIGAVFFYSKFLKSWSQCILTSLEKSEKDVSELMNEMMSDKGFLDFMNNGGGSIQLVK